MIQFKQHMNKLLKEKQQTHVNGQLPTSNNGSAEMHQIDKEKENKEININNDNLIMVSNTTESSMSSHTSHGPIIDNVNSRSPSQGQTIIVNMDNYSFNMNNYNNNYHNKKHDFTVFSQFSASATESTRYDSPSSPSLQQPTENKETDHDEKHDHRDHDMDVIALDTKERNNSEHVSSGNVTNSTNSTTATTTTAGTTTKTLLRVKNSSNQQRKAIGSKLCKLNITNHVPLSYIIVNNKKDIEKQVELIIDKYIVSSSELMVNISSDARQKLINWKSCKIFKESKLESKLESNSNDIEMVDEHCVKQYAQLVEWNQIFDSALEEVYQLLKSTFLRFKKGGYKNDIKKQELLQIAKIIGQEKEKRRQKEKHSKLNLLRRVSISMSRSEKRNNNN